MHSEPSASDLLTHPCPRARPAGVAHLAALLPGLRWRESGDCESHRENLTLGDVRVRKHIRRLGPNVDRGYRLYCSIWFRFHSLSWSGVMF